LRARLGANDPAGLLWPCHTVGVSFHETFWVVTGTAAPVIALAAIVSVRDVSDDVDAMQALPRELEDRASQLGKTILLVYYRDWCANWGVVTSIVEWANIALQAVLLAFSLLSIAYARNAFPLWIAIVVSVAGVLLLAATDLVMMAGRQKTGLKRVLLAQSLEEAAEAKKGST
jgi:hypothetical protein